ncbi:MAG: poly-gamma-glutamate biosynthesis protein PgsC/CapC [Lachnospiraceae bacterium]|nr:poly-gamma-glutamate biosynthesis protein PgsC/CapC [Lachnospiraceae bacterium]
MYKLIILLSALISILYTELTGLSTGLIVPGYLVLQLAYPQRILYTIFVAAAASLVLKWTSGFLVLYGRRRFVFLMVVTLLLDMILAKTGLVPGSADLIGILVPGLIARDFDRQGYADGLISLFVVTGLLAALLLALGYPLFRA